MEAYESSKSSRSATTWRRSLIAVLTSVALACGMILVAGGTAQAAPPETYNMASWNMQYGPTKWGDVYHLAQTREVVALQEVPNRLPLDLLDENGHNTQGSRIPNTDVRHWEWRSGNGPVRHLYVLRTGSRNLGIVTSWSPDAVVVIDGSYRPALAVVNHDDDIMFASIHARTRGGHDAPQLLRAVADAAPDHANNWVALGDYNRDPDSWNNTDIPRPLHPYRPYQATHMNGGEYDYAIGNLGPDRWTAAADDNHDSDHWPVLFNGTSTDGEPASRARPNRPHQPVGERVSTGERNETEKPAKRARKPVNIPFGQAIPGGKHDEL